MTEPAIAQPVVYAGAKAPEAVVVTILPGSSGVDLSTCTKVEFQVTVNTVVAVVGPWATTFDLKRSDKLVVRHVFDTAGVETRVPGLYRLLPVLTLPTGVVRAKPFYLAVAS